MSADTRPSGDEIAVVEPHCWGLEHAAFNAALLTAVAVAYPATGVAMYGESRHLEGMRDLLAATRPTVAARTRWCPVDVPLRKSRGLSRLRGVRRLFRMLDSSFALRRPEAVVMATLNPAVLTLLKIRLHTSWSGAAAVGVFHELLGSLTRRSSRRWALEMSLRLPHPRRLTYLVLSECIRRHLVDTRPWLAPHVGAVELPSVLSAMGGSHRNGVRELRMGFIGGGRDAKGFNEFLSLAVDVRREHPEIVFEVVGSAPPGISSAARADLVWAEQELPFPEYVERLRGLSHVVWLGAPHHYHLVASSSLTDAVSLGIPVICRSGPLVNHLFERFGNIGVRCDTMSDVRREITRVAVAASDDADGRRQSLAAAVAALQPEVAAAPFMRRALSRVTA